MKRNPYAPLTLPVHRELLEEINEMSIDIKTHHIECDEKKQKPEQWAKLQVARPHVPTWEEIDKLLMRAYHAINEQRKDPSRY